MFFLFYYLYGMLFYQKKDFSQAKICFTKALEIRSNHDKANFKLGMCYFKLSEWREANEFIKKALILNPLKKSWSIQLKQTENHLNSMIFIPQKLWWKEVEDLKKQIHKKGGNFFIYKELAIALEFMKRYQEAVEYYQLALKHSKVKDAWVYYKAGFCSERSKEVDFNLVKKLYANAIKYDNELNSKYLGIGIFHEKDQYWIEANKAYLDLYQHGQNLHNDKLLFKIAFSFEKICNYIEAEKYYKKALEVNFQEADFHYRLGIILEKMAKYEEACIYYENALKRSDQHKSFWYFRLCKCLNVLKKYDKSSEILEQSQIIQNNPYGLPEDALKDKILRRRIFYTECYEKLKIQDNMILYESFHGKSMSCNPYAIFLYLLDKSDFKDFIHIWVVNDLKSVRSKFKKMKNVICAKRGSDLYLKYLASAKYLINNVTFPDYFIRKEGQLYLNTWHGIPIKHLGKKIQTGFMEYANVQRNFIQATHLIHPNKYTKEIIEKDYGIEHLFTGKSVLTGYPRVDLLFKQNNNLKKALNITKEQKVLLYAPTWRGGLNSQYFDFNRLISDIKELKKLNFKILLSVHHEVKHLLLNDDLEDVLIPEWIEMNELLSIVDVLISDYSSIVFDFMVLNRPIIYYIYDYEFYKKERGVYFDIYEIAQYTCKTIEELKAILNSKELFEQKITPEKLKDKFLSLEDGQSSKRVVSEFFQCEGDGKCLHNNILFYAGPFIPNGIANSFKNLLYYLRKLDFNIYIAIDPNAIYSYPERLEQFDILCKDVQILPRVGALNLTLEEFDIEKQRIESVNSLKIYKREIRRLYGDVNFKAVINFEGYNVFWVKLFSCIEDKNFIFLHNNMYGEFEKKYSYLEKNFKCYNDYKKILSVSKQTSEENKKNLANRYSIQEEKFDFLENTINGEEILRQSQIPLEGSVEKKYFRKNYKIFINIARLSVEKDQLKLVKAFKIINKKYPKTKLLILGDGPLRSDLENLIKELRLNKSVFLLGRILNPFPYLKKSDCFVMSSIHEGQPMTLLEALVLNKAIVATNIPGNVSVLDGRGGLIVDNSENGLVEGMKKFLCGKIENKKFDYVQYNLKILSKLDILLKGNNYE
ncbi:CDP-glycerol glycerophosphotransferase family protein [Campylobacter taeniopygiae]|uniref:CDP-glycerol glycerophosphotransferase family protein n=1 Tax=Campylobacter taeniopygiae TaxID=2510188 RepID=UPI003D6A515F